MAGYRFFLLKGLNRKFGRKKDKKPNKEEKKNYYNLLVNSDILWKAQLNDLKFVTKKRNNDGSVEAYIKVDLANLHRWDEVKQKTFKIPQAYFPAKNAHVTLRLNQAFANYSHLHFTYYNSACLMIAAERVENWLKLIPSKGMGSFGIAATCNGHGLLRALQAGLPGGLNANTDRENRLHISFNVG